MKSSKKRSAVIIEATSIFKRTMVNTIKKDLYLAKNMEEAKEWVIS